MTQDYTHANGYLYYTLLVIVLELLCGKEKSPVGLFSFP
jgi:hypothetical protein